MKVSIDKVLGTFLSILMAVMTLIVLWGVLTRYAFSNQASWTGELARFLLIWIGLLGAAYASGQRKHLAIDLLSDKLNDNNRIMQFRLIAFLVILFAICILITGGVRLLYITLILEQSSPALNIPMSFVYSVLPLSGLLIVYYQIEKLSNTRA